MALQLPGEVWRLIANHLPYDDRRLVLRFLRVSRDAFTWAEDLCWRALFHLLHTQPHQSGGRDSVAGDEHDGVLYFYGLARRMTTQPERLFTRENMSFLLALTLHSVPPDYRVNDWCYRIFPKTPLAHLYRFDERSHALVSLDKDPAVRVYERPPGELRQPNEAEQYALDCEHGSYKYALFYAATRDQLVLREPLPDDPLCRVVLDGEHIFSKRRIDECGALFSYKGRRGAEQIRVTDMLATYASRFEKPMPVPVRLFQTRPDGPEWIHPSTDSTSSTSASERDDSSTSESTLDSAQFSDDDLQEEDEEESTSSTESQTSDCVVVERARPASQRNAALFDDIFGQDSEKSLSVTLSSGDESDWDDDDDSDLDADFRLRSDEMGSNSASDGEEASDDSVILVETIALKPSQRTVIDCTG